MHNECKNLLKGHFFVKTNGLSIKVDTRICKKGLVS